MNNTKGAANSTVQQIKKSTVFSFKKRAPIPSLGLNRASWVSAVNEAPAEGDDFNDVVLTIKIESSVPGGKAFELTKRYSLAGNRRGASAFLDDYNSWSETKMTEDSFYDSFDGLADAGKPLAVNVGHRKVGKEWEAYIKGFHPAGTPETPAES
jgi:hypothetical protein